MSFQEAKETAEAIRASIVNYDEFFIIRDGWNNTKDRRFSLYGLQFITEFITQAVKLAGLNPSQVTIRVGEKELYHDVISIAYPSPSTTLLTRLTVSEGMLKFERRKTTKDEDYRSLKTELNMANPNVQQELADIIRTVVPKNSKFMEKKK